MTTSPKLGVINREWVVEVFASTPFAAGKATFNSVRKTVVSEAYFLNGIVAGTAIGYASVLAHDRSIPDQGTIGATLAATLAPQQFQAAFMGVNGGTVGGSIITQAVFLIRGR